MVALFSYQSKIIDFPQKAGSNEWYTPACYVDAAREVFGGVIGLDPASCELANRTVRAKRYYTKEQDGLIQDWTCESMWMNPPFTGTHLREIWTRRLIEDYERGTVKQAILCMPSALDTQWFQALWAYPICFPASRIYSYQELIHKGNPNFAACLVYFGAHEQRFINVFSAFGTVAKRVSKPRQQVTPLSLWEVR